MRGSNAKYNKPEWIGQKFGRLTVKKAVKANSGTHRSHWEWVCKCDCGKEVTAVPASIVLGTTRSCGCYAHELISKLGKQSAHKYPTYQYKQLWWKYNAMKTRCNNSDSPRYADYGGRGIKVCEEWNNSFDAFVEWALSHGYEEGLTIERLDVDGDYCPENCIFITLEEQAKNKRNTIWVNYDGKRVRLIELCEKKGMPYRTVKRRIKRGWSVEDAIEKPTKVETLADKCREYGISYTVVSDRINKLGWDEERALTTPARHMERKKGQVSQ